MLVGLSEIAREGIPAAIGSQLMRRASKARSAGSEYLNYQFGWMPLVRDIKALATAVRDQDKILAQFQRDSGKWIRRSYEFPEEVMTEVANQSTTGKIQTFSNTTAVNRIFNGTILEGPQTETVVKTRRAWFSGAYTYYLESGGSIADRARRYGQQANHLLGLSLTPEVLWNLAPWSWLSDWQVNIGQNIRNASMLTSDGLVIVYGYLMVETTTKHTVTVAGPGLAGQPSQLWGITFNRVKKIRLKANPYGFGSNPASYTGRQWAILGSLGLTKAPGTLF